MQPNNIGEARRAYAKAHGEFTQKDAAAYFGVSVGTYRNWEQGRTGLNLGQLSAIADKYGVTIDYLLHRAPHRPEYLTPQESELLDIMRTITPEGQKQLMIYARGIASTYSKSNQVKSA